MAQHWEVVGGRDQGGILVRTGQNLSSPAEPERLATGSLLEELELVGERLHYRLLDGSGPALGWVTTRLQQKVLVERTEAPAGQQSTPGGLRLRHFDLLHGPVDRGEADGPEPDTGPLADILSQYGITDFAVESVLRTELGRDKFFVRVRQEAGTSGDAASQQLFVGCLAEDGPKSEAVEASFAAFLELGRHCRPDLVRVAQFMRTKGGTYLHDRHLVAPAQGPSNWGRSPQDRLMLASAIGELHRASDMAFSRGLPKQVERDLVCDEVGLGVLEWGLTVDYSQSGLASHEVGRIKYILSSLRMLDRPARIMDLPKMVVHVDLQFKNFCRSSEPGCRAPVLVDFKLGHIASRIWDLYFILCGDDLCSLLPQNDKMTEDFISAIRRYEEVSEMPFSEEESFLLMNTIMIKAIFNSCYFGSFVAHLPGSRQKCKAAFETMEWIIERKDYFRSVF